MADNSAPNTLDKVEKKKKKAKGDKTKHKTKSKDEGPHKGKKKRDVAPSPDDAGSFQGVDIGLNSLVEGKKGTPTVETPSGVELPTTASELLLLQQDTPNPTKRLPLNNGIPTLNAEIALPFQESLEQHEESNEKLRIINLDTGQPVLLHDLLTGSTSGTPVAANAPEHNLSTSEPIIPPRIATSHSPVAPRKSLYWTTPSIARVGGAASSLTLGIGRGLAAGIAAVRSPAKTPTEDSDDGIRLPRREVDEDQLVQDMMRFVDARDVLQTSNDPNVFRDLGLRLESAWRAKLNEGQELRNRLDEAQDVLEDLEEENEHLRDQLAQLSEQVVNRDEACQKFQHRTVAQHGQERTFWVSEVREAKQDAQVQVAQAKALLLREKALSAQLRLNIHAVKLGRIDTLNQLEVDEPIGDGDGAPDNGSGVTDEAREAPAGDGGLPDAGTGGERKPVTIEDEDDVGEDVLYQLQDKRPMDPESSVPSTKKDEFMSLAAMYQAGLIDERQLLGTQERQQTDNADPTGTLSAVAGASSVLFDKAAADAALAVALQQKNTALRAHEAAQNRRYREMQDELTTLRQRLAATEAVVDEVLNSS